MAQGRCQWRVKGFGGPKGSCAFRRPTVKGSLSCTGKMGRLRPPSAFIFRQKKRALRPKPVHVGVMLESVNTRDPSGVQGEVLAAFKEMFPQGDPALIPTIFGWAVSWFSGQYGDYQPIDAHYHDLEHTLQGILCMARLLRRRHCLGQEPRLTQRMFELGMLAMLTHDTGYLKKRGDNQGTGAKYTLIHVDRSIQFAGELMLGHDFAVQDILDIVKIHSGFRNFDAAGLLVVPVVRLAPGIIHRHPIQYKPVVVKSGDGGRDGHAPHPVGALGHGKRAFA